MSLHTERDEEKDRDRKDQPRMQQILSEDWYWRLLRFDNILSALRRRLTLEEFCGRRRSIPDLAISGGGGAGSLQELSLISDSSFFFLLLSSLSPLSPNPSATLSVVLEENTDPSPEVQAVLLLLGGYEVPTRIPTTSVATQNHRTLDDFPERSSQPQRVASLNRFREKRKERCFENKIRYNVRKEVALRVGRSCEEQRHRRGAALQNDVVLELWGQKKIPNKTTSFYLQMYSPKTTSFWGFGRQNGAVLQGCNPAVREGTAITPDPCITMFY
ncbi:hypothetical protein Acr_17g0004690 [Actinidia rufa]|uniref:CCT domain-containing protein n=1 Tax=Actinidia rufa TaxID=165716 RepID=A0A7J0G276_9ERIC|nr:hypothetical protein Acr_17g0004690 [Actinidia rufa]